MIRGGQRSLVLVCLIVDKLSFQIWFLHLAKMYKQFDSVDFVSERLGYLVLLSI
ncbi:hypothetical protein [Okeania sp. SIO2B3]|uniref:hypothetical protein n=1 Tax=Okeania sp. SIO2B3 TaxID=2607784 RepID=UPI0013C143FA|nr:hypothetical protein [Okeania sp. SIO2B3]NET40822.1 hypothetical protein [Okeania sp. SIO2B3]